MTFTKLGVKGTPKNKFTSKRLGKKLVIKGKDVLKETPFMSGEPLDFSTFSKYKKNEMEELEINDFEKKELRSDY